MNYLQEQAIKKTREKIQEIRNMLDDAMYHSDPMDDSTYRKVREAYGKICEANDILP